MLGRYVGGTVLVLGAAMLIAPEKPEASGDAALVQTQPLLVQDDLRPDPVELISPEKVFEASAAAAPTPQPTTTNATQPALQTVSVGLDPQPRVNVTLPATQIGGIAALAGIEAQPLPTAIVTRPLPDAAVAAPAPETTAIDTGPDYRFVTGTRVNVRSGPSTDYRVISSVIQGDSVEVLSRASDWVEIRIVGTEAIGYMAERFLTAENG